MTSCDVDVLVIGAGPTGGTAALALARMGVSVEVATMYNWVANSPRAHVTSQRTMEVFRDLGIEDELRRQGVPWELMGDMVLGESLVGREFARLPSWGVGEERHGEYVASSPCEYLDIIQPRMEPIVLAAAAQAGARLTWGTELVSFEQDDEGVTARLRTRATGSEREVRCRYMIGADGARSSIVEALGLPLEGHLARAGTVYARYRADLTEHVSHRPSVLNFFFNPRTAVGEIGMGMIRAVTPWTEWLSSWGFDMANGEPDTSPEAVTATIRTIIGDPDVDVELLDVSIWYVNQQYATAYSRGRVLCAGDAVHRHPPSSGLGLNTSVQDAFNLAWKLAMVIQGEAGTGLLETYSAERAPVGRQIVLRANQSRHDYAALRSVLVDPDDDRDPIDRLLAPTPEGVELRDRLDDALRLKDHEFNAAGVEKNQRYVSTAVLPDTEAAPEEFPRDIELYDQPTTRPGAKLPHVWLFDARGRRQSVLDVVGHGRFTLVTGLAGTAWETALAELEEPWLRPLVIGRPDCQDLHHAWHRRREVHEAGCLLVRPDAYIAWRHLGPVWEVDVARKHLSEVLDLVLSRRG